MPAVSEKQRRYMAMCHEDPGKASCPKGMTREQMHDFMKKPKGGFKGKKKRRKGGAVRGLMGN